MTDSFFQMDKKNLLILFLTVLITGAMIALFFILFEKVEIEQISPESENARNNPFLAAERFLQQYGIQAGTVKSKDILINLPPTTDSIIVNKMIGNLPPDREDALVAWIENGGQLVIVHDRKYNDALAKSGNSLLDRFDIRLYDACATDDTSEVSKQGPPVTPETPTKNPPDSSVDTHDADTGKGPDNDSPKETEGCQSTSFQDRETVVKRFDSGESATIGFDTRRILVNGSEDTVDAVAGEYGNHIIKKAIGQGALVVVSDNQFLKNTYIGNHDHAFFLKKMVADRTSVWFLFHREMPSLFMLVLHKAPYFVISLAILLIAILVRMNTTIGPVYRKKDLARRNIIEHLLATGHFIRKQDKSYQQIETLRQGIKKQITTKFIQFDKYDQELQIQMISKWTGLTANEVKTAFKANVRHTEEFIQVTGLLQKIYAKIHVNPKTQRA